MTQTLACITAVRDALTVLGDMNLPIAYQIARNLKAASAIIDEANDIGRSFIEGMVGSREPRLLVVTPGANKQRPHVPGLPVLEGEVVVYNLTDSERQIVADFEREMAAAEHTITWHTIAASKVDGLAVPGNMLVPLLGVIVHDAEAG